MEKAYDLGTVLKRLRQQRKMTQTALGERLGLTKAAISKYESGIASPPLETLRAIAVLFNVSMDYLCGTEQREKISVYNLKNEQIAVINRLVSTFRSKNEQAPLHLSPEDYQLLGKILELLS